MKVKGKFQSAVAKSTYPKSPVSLKKAMENWLKEVNYSVMGDKYQVYLVSVTPDGFIREVSAKPGVRPWFLFAGWVTRNGHATNVRSSSWLFSGRTWFRCDDISPDDLGNLNRKEFKRTGIKRPPWELEKGFMKLVREIET